MVRTEQEARAAGIVSGRMFLDSTGMVENDGKTKVETLLFSCDGKQPYLCANCEISMFDGAIHILFQPGLQGGEESSIWIGFNDNQLELEVFHDGKENGQRIVLTKPLEESGDQSQEA